MPQFKNREEYDKWRSEKIRSNLEKIEKEKQEEKLNRLWVCPACLSSNDKSQLTCNCGHVLIEKEFQDYRGNLSSGDLYKTIKNEIFIGNRDRAIFLSKYLLKRFSRTEESDKIKEDIDSSSKEIICGKCGTKNIYNKYYEKDTCERCGDFLHQYLHENITPTVTPKCPTCNSISIEKISLTNKIGTAALIGVFSIGRISKTFKCNNCGYRW
jgi:hypothetical protein